MKKSLVVLIFIVGVVCLFFQHQMLNVYGIYLKTAGILLTMFSVYKLSNMVGSKKEENDSGNLKF